MRRSRGIENSIFLIFKYITVPGFVVINYLTSSNMNSARTDVDWFGRVDVST